MPVWSTECPFPPGEKPFGEKGEKVDPNNPTHIGPENGLRKREFKLKDNQGEGCRELKGTEQYGKQYLYQIDWI